MWRCDMNEIHELVPWMINLQLVMVYQCVEQQLHHGKWDGNSSAELVTHLLETMWVLIVAQVFRCCGSVQSSSL